MTATDQSAELFDRFKELNPNSKEVFEPTLANLQRWHWHVNEAMFRPQYEKIIPGEIGTADARYIRARRFRTVAAMPNYMRKRFTELAALFIGKQVFAAGSRVTGEWIEKDSPPEVARLRESLGKAPKLESDYDIWFKTEPGEDHKWIRDRLPKWADFIPNGIPDNQKVPIPMWNWDRLPKTEHAAAVDMFNNQRWGALMALHNKYQLSPQTLCCDDKPVREWFEWAIKEKIIQK